MQFSNSFVTDYKFVLKIPYLYSGRRVVYSRLNSGLNSSGNNVS